SSKETLGRRLKFEGRPKSRRAESCFPTPTRDKSRVGTLGPAQDHPERITITRQTKLSPTPICRRISRAENGQGGGPKRRRQQSGDGRVHRGPDESLGDRGVCVGGQVAAHT